MSMKLKPVKLEKSKLDNNDPTALNYLALAAAILKADEAILIPPELYDKKEGKRRIREIEALRETGGETGYEKYMDSYYNEKGKAGGARRAIEVKMIDPITGEEKIFMSITKAEEALGIPINYLAMAFRRKKVTKLTYRGYIFEKL